MPTEVVRAILDSFNPGPWSPEISQGVAKARRLWHLIKEQEPLSACGLVRLASPVACDLVGVVTWEDLYPDRSAKVASAIPSNRSILEDDLLGDEISEYVESIHNLRFGHSQGPRAAEQQEITPPIGSPTSSPAWGQGAAYGAVSSTPAPAAPVGQAGSEPEMTLIDPATKCLFKRSWGGTFGAEGWPVSGIRAFAVWF